MLSDYTHYAFSVAPENFAVIVERLRKVGVQEWKSNHSEGESCYFLDPDRHALEIHCGDSGKPVGSLPGETLSGDGVLLKRNGEKAIRLKLKLR